MHDFRHGSVERNPARLGQAPARYGRGSARLGRGVPAIGWFQRCENLGRDRRLQKRRKTPSLHRAPLIGARFYFYGVFATLEGTMRKHLLATIAVLLAACVAAPGNGIAKGFTVEKFDLKGEGGTDYIAADAATGRVFVSRGTHLMVVGANRKVIGDIPNTPGVHGAGIAVKAGHGFTTNGGDETVTMFDLKTLAAIRQIHVGPGLDGIMYDD